MRSSARTSPPSCASSAGVFAVIAGFLLILNVIQAWLNLQTKLKLREGLTRDLIGQWMGGALSGSPRRATSGSIRTSAS